MRIARSTAQTSVLLLIIASLFLAFPTRSSAQSSPLATTMTNVDLAMSKMVGASPADRAATLATLKDQLKQALDASKDDPLFTAGEYQLGRVENALEQYPDAETEFLAVSNRPDVSSTMQMQSLLDAYHCGISSAEDPTKIDADLVRLDTIYNACKSTLGNQSNYWERAEVGLNALRMQADMAYGDSLAKPLEAAGKQADANAIRIKWIDAAIADCDKYIGDLNGAMGQHQAAWLRAMNLGTENAADIRTQLVADKAKLAGAAN